MDSPENRVFRSNDAEQLLANPLLRDAFKKVDQYIDQVALSCDPDDKNRAQRVILSKQLLASIIRQIERVIEDGEVAKVEIQELKKRSMLRVFQR